MGVIETEEAAKRLARVIVSDIEIYNREKFQAGADLTAAIEEGRALFRSRVAPELHPLFTSVLEDRRASRKKAESAPRAADAPAAERNGLAAPASAERNGIAAAPAAPAAKPAVPRTTNRTAAAEPVAAAASSPAAATPPPIAHAAPPATAYAATGDTAPVVAAAPAAPAATPAPVAAARPSPSVRGGIIDTEEAAARLARVILSDIELYGAKKIAAGIDLTYEIEEGRHLFKSRVSGELLVIFENALATKSFGPRRRVASPVPVPRARPPVVEAEPTPAAPVAPRTRTPAPVAARPQVSAAKAPPASQPRPGLAPARPATAPHGIPAAVIEGASARHLSAFSPGAGGVTPPPTVTSPLERSGRHLAPPPGRAAAASYTPDLIDRAADQPTPMPGGYPGSHYEEDVATPEPAAAQVSITPPPAPAPARVSAPRMAATPPPVPARASAAMRTVGAAPPAPTRRERVPSSPEFPVNVDSAPIPVDDVHAEMPSQEVLDALPASTPLPGPSVPAPAPRMSVHTIPRVSTPQSLPMTEAPTALQAPAPMGLEAPAMSPVGEQIGESIGGNEGDIVSLRRRMSTPRLMLTIFTLGGAAAAIWYFLLR